MESARVHSRPTFFQKISKRFGSGEVPQRDELSFVSSRYGRLQMGCPSANQPRHGFQQLVRLQVVASPRTELTTSFRFSRCVAYSRQVSCRKPCDTACFAAWTLRRDEGRENTRVDAWTSGAQCLNRMLPRSLASDAARHQVVTGPTESWRICLTSPRRGWMVAPLSKPRGVSLRKNLPSTGGHAMLISSIFFSPRAACLAAARR